MDVLTPKSHGVHLTGHVLGAEITVSHSIIRRQGDLQAFSRFRPLWHILNHIYDYSAEVQHKGQMYQHWL